MPFEPPSVPSPQTRLSAPSLRAPSTIACSPPLLADEDAGFPAAATLAEAALLAPAEPVLVELPAGTAGDDAAPQPARINAKAEIVGNARRTNTIVDLPLPATRV